MPFTESQPINIHDLVIESPVNPDHSVWPDPYAFLEVTAEEIDLMANNPISREKRIVFGSEVAIPEKRAERMKNDIPNLPLFSEESLTTGSLLACFGHTPPYTQLDKLQLVELFRIHEESAIKNRMLGLANNLKIMAEVQSITGPIQIDEEFTGVALKYLDGVPPTHYLTYFSNLKLAGVIYQSPDKDIRRALDFLTKLDRKQFQPLGLMNIIAQMKVASSDEIRYGSEGIELIKNAKTKFNTTPPIPAVRNF